MTETRHYNAFISYRHLEIDSYVAEKLQKLLENYKPPKGVGETDRIQHIFLEQLNRIWFYKMLRQVSM